jgi:hypothetical protein
MAPTTDPRSHTPSEANLGIRVMVSATWRRPAGLRHPQEHSKIRDQRTEQYLECERKEWRRPPPQVGAEVRRGHLALEGGRTRLLGRTARGQAARRREGEQPSGATESGRRTSGAGKGRPAGTPFRFYKI